MEGQVAGTEQGDERDKFVLCSLFFHFNAECFSSLYNPTGGSSHTL